MRKVFLWLTVMMLTVIFCAFGSAEERPRIILYTAYRQVGWGDAVQIGCVDEDGGLWSAVGYDSKLKWPYRWEEQLDYLRTSDTLTEAGTLPHDDLFSLQSLIASVKPTEEKTQGWMCDAGTETSVALRYDREGNATAILLGMTGDDFLENTDVNAQALYAKLRVLFPFVRSYAGEINRPWGFQPVSVASFCGLEGIDWENVTITAYNNDCESGPEEMEITAEDAKQVIQYMKTAMVTGKENAADVTGGYMTLCSSDRNGNLLGFINLYEGLLMRGDGMYRVER